MTYNKVIMVARIVSEPELKHTTSGTPVCSFRVVTDRGYGDNKKSDFHTCVAWRNGAEFVSKYFRKGGMIGIEGSLQNREYTDRDGNNRTATEIVVSTAFFVGNKETNREEADRNTGGFSPVVDDYEQAGDNGDLPF